MSSLKIASLKAEMYLYLSIYRNVLRSSLQKKKKNGAANLQPPCNQPQKIKAYPKGAHCILMLTLQICSTSINHFPSCSLQNFFKLKKNALIAITPTPPNFNLSP
jgi:hypothetical protein